MKFPYEQTLPTGMFFSIFIHENQQFMEFFLNVSISKLKRKLKFPESALQILFKRRAAQYLIFSPKILRNYQKTGISA